MSLFRDEKVPFFLAALLGFLAWSLMRVVDRITAAPLIAYSESDPGQGQRQVSFDVHNISGTMFKDIQLTVLLTDSKGEFLGRPEIIAELPMTLANNPPAPATDSVSFHLAELQPGWKFRIQATVTADASPELAFASPSQPAQLVQTSWRTYLVEHEVNILLVLAAGATLLAVAYVFAI
jgi:hypothetical protein